MEETVVSNEIFKRLEPIPLVDKYNAYQARSKSKQIHRVSAALGLDETALQNIMGLKLTENNINEYGRFDALKNTADLANARVFFEKRQGAPISDFRLRQCIDDFLRTFLLEGGFDVAP